MRIDSIAVRLRPRGPLEAADFGVRLCQHAARDVYICYLAIAVPMFALAVSLYEWGGWLPALLIMWSKPWLDRTILFVLSRAAFGQRTTLGDLWRAQRQVWWRGLLFSWTIRRLSPWRSFTEPVYQLEGVSVWKAGARIRQLRQRTMGSGVDDDVGVRDGGERADVLGVLPGVLAVAAGLASGSVAADHRWDFDVVRTDDHAVVRRRRSCFWSRSSSRPDSGCI